MIHFKISNRVIDFFVTTVYSLPTKEQSKKDTLLAQTLLIYNKLFV